MNSLDFEINKRAYTNEDDASKRYHWEILLGAIIEWGSDPTRIECEEDARTWADVLDNANVWQIDDAYDKEDAAAKLEVGADERIYAFVNGSRGNFVLDR